MANMEQARLIYVILNKSIQSSGRIFKMEAEGCKDANLTPKT